MGRATFTVDWPAPTSRLIPAASTSIRVEVRDGATVLDSRLLVRPQGGGSTTAVFGSLPTGDFTAAASAYPEQDGGGTAQASATVPLRINNGQNTAFTLTMATTIAAIQVTPQALTLNPGQTLQLTATPRDASSRVVLTLPGNMQWSAGSSGAVTVSPSGLVTAISVGNAQVTARDTESDRAGSTAVSVTQGGNGGGGGTTPVKVDVRWGERSRWVDAPSSALSVTFTLRGASAGGGDFHFTVNRGGGTAAHVASYVSANLAVPGSWQLDAKAYAQPNGTGMVVASGLATATIRQDGTGMPDFSLLGTVDRVEVPLAISLPLGGAKDIPYTVKDRNGETLLVSYGSALFQILEGAGLAEFKSGSIEGKGLGWTRYRVTVDNKSAEGWCRVVPANAPLFTLYDLGLIRSYAINNNGEIVGVDEAGVPQAVRWDGTRWVTLPRLAGSFAAAFDINDAGDIVGVSELTPGSLTRRAVLWRNGQTVDLGVASGYANSLASSINNFGKVAGFSYNGTHTLNPYGLGPTASSGFLWTGGLLQDLGNIGGQITTPVQINDNDAITGHATIESTGERQFRAFVWRNGQIDNLGVPGNYPYSLASDVGPDGSVLVHTTLNSDPTSPSETFVWKAGVYTSIARYTLGHPYFHFAGAINRHGHMALPQGNQLIIGTTSWSLEEYIPPPLHSSYNRLGPRDLNAGTADDHRTASPPDGTHAVRRTCRVLQPRRVVYVEGLQAELLF
jgi:probable HAF family extracellular repeat protein